jgi:hypothetical protein
LSFYFENSRWKRILLHKEKNNYHPLCFNCREAINTQTQKKVAIKQLFNLHDPQVLKRALREVRLLRFLQHPNVHNTTNFFKSWIWNFWCFQSRSFCSLTQDLWFLHYVRSLIFMMYLWWNPVQILMNCTFFFINNTHSNLTRWTDIIPGIWFNRLWISIYTVY